MKHVDHKKSNARGERGYPGWGRGGSCYGFVAQRSTGDTGKQSFPITRKPKKVDNKVDKGIAKLNQGNKENGGQRKQRIGRQTRDNPIQLKRHPGYERCYSYRENGPRESHRQKSRTFCSRIHLSAEYPILHWDKNKMAARTSKRSKERKVPYRILNDLSSVDLLYEEKNQKKKNFEQISWYFCF